MLLHPPALLIRRRQLRTLALAGVAARTEGVAQDRRASEGPGARLAPKRDVKETRRN